MPTLIQTDTLRFGREKPVGSGYPMGNPDMYFTAAKLFPSWSLRNCRRRQLWTFSSSLMLGGLCASVVIAQTQGVNPSLFEFQNRFSEPKVVRLNQRIHAAVAFDFSNFGFIEGNDGVIVVDTGWFPGSVQPAWDTFRQVCSKPVKAIIYTHVHGDHTGGATVFAKDSVDDLAIYSPNGWKQRLDYSATSQYHMIFRRAFAQMGLLLPNGHEGTVGSGIGPAPRPAGVPQFLVPTVTVADRREFEIAGVRVELIPTPGDIESHMMVWFPQDRVLFCGDVLGGTLPYIATPRFEPDRDPYGFVKSLEIALELKPDKIVPGHGRLLIGRSDVEDVLQANIDIIRFLADQVERYVTKGYSADRIIDTLKVPKALANHPDLQPHYHRLDWIIRGLALKQAGFVGDVIDLCRLTDSEEAKRLVRLLGGTESTLDHAQKALEDDDPRWGATLANYVMLVEPNNERASEMRVRAFQRISATTQSAPERNYLLTAAKEQTEGIDWNAILARPAKRACKDRPSSELLAAMSVRFDVDQSDGTSMAVQINIDGEHAANFLLIRRYALIYRDALSETPDAEISLTRETLNELWAKQMTWSRALEDGAIRVQSGEAAVQKFVKLIE